MSELFRQILVFLAQRYAAESQSYDESDRACRDAVHAKMLFSTDEGSLETMLARNPDHGEVVGWGKWLFLPAPEHGRLRVPVLNVIYDFSKTPAAISIQAGLFYLNPNGEAKAVGWRFESPEEPGAGGAHSTHAYYHAQPSPGLRRLSGDRDLPLGDPDAPSGAPTLPLDAEDAVDLLLCMLLSIYGLTGTLELLTAADLKEATKRLKAMRTVKAGAP